MCTLVLGTQLKIKKAPGIGARNEYLLVCKDTTSQEKVKGNFELGDVKLLV
jgi:hypothetical protein